MIQTLGKIAIDDRSGHFPRRAFYYRGHREHGGKQKNKVFFGVRTKNLSFPT